MRKFQTICRKYPGLKLQLRMPVKFENLQHGPSHVASGQPLNERMDMALMFDWETGPRSPAYNGVSLVSKHILNKSYLHLLLCG